MRDRETDTEIQDVTLAEKMLRLFLLEAKLIKKNAGIYNNFPRNKCFSIIVGARKDQTILVQRAISILRFCQSLEGYNIVLERKHGVKYAST